MDSIVDPFYTTCPAFRNNPNFSFIQCNVGSTMFWDKVNEIADRLNYAVVATGNDMLNLRIALEIYNVVRKARNNDLHDFIVLTRSYDPSHQQHIDCVVDFYNSTNASSGGRIIPYGRKGDIFDYNLVFNSLVAKGFEVFYITSLLPLKPPLSLPERHVPNGFPDCVSYSLLCFSVISVISGLAPMRSGAVPPRPILT